MIQLFKRNNHFDVFISYRDDESKHSTSLARTVSQAYKENGYKVFFDKWYQDIDWEEAIDNSDNYVILLTDYSFIDKNRENEDRTTFQKKKIDRFASEDELSTYLNGILPPKGDFETEFKKICEKIREKQIGKEQVRCLNVDNSIPLKDDEIKSEILFFIKNNFELYPLETKDKIKEKEYLHHVPEFGRVLVRHSTWARLGKWMVVASLLLATALVWCGVRLAQYSGPGILFAGGGSAKNYIANKMGVDVNDYGPNSIYVHMPSTAAYDLLWDYINDSSSYYPIVLSAGEMDISKVDKNRFENRGKKILQYRLGEVALLVQLRNYEGTKYKKGDSIITVDDLSMLLSDTTINKICYTTTKGSGTYACYDAILPLGLRDSNYTVFTPEDYDVGEKTTLHIYLANESYAIKEKKDDHVLSLKIIDSIGGPTKMLGLFLYAVGEHNTQGTKYMPSAPVKKFFKKLKLDINEDLYYNDKEGMIIKLN